MQQEDPDKNEHKEDPNRHGNRLPSRPVMFVITPEGIQSPVDNSDIITYELWDHIIHPIACESL